MPSPTFLYFAYGSNMLTERLQRRCPSARPLGAASAPGFSIRFVKRGADGSGKATLVSLGADEPLAHGVLFEIARHDLPSLDRAEGNLYRRDDLFSVVAAIDGSAVIASTYRALPEACDATLLPFDWYLALTLAGAHQHALPAPYIRWLSRQRLTKDPDPSRPAGQEALAVIRAAGLDSMTTQRV